MDLNQQPVFLDWRAENKKRELAEKRRRAHLQRERRKHAWHGDNEKVLHELRRQPCSACGATNVGAAFRRGQYSTSFAWYEARCPVCSAKGSWPVTGLPVECYVANIRREMSQALIKAMCK